MREGVFVPDLTRSGVRVRGLGLVWTSGPTRSDRDQHQTRSRTRHRNLTRPVSYVNVLLTSLIYKSHRSSDQNRYMYVFPLNNDRIFQVATECLSKKSRSSLSQRAAEHPMQLTKKKKQCLFFILFFFVESGTLSVSIVCIGYR